MYIPQLTFLRFLAALLVVVFHFGQQNTPFNKGIIAQFVAQGSIAVSFFFFLSGVVLALNYTHKTPFKTFYKKRIARLMPVYIMAFIITLLLSLIFNNARPKGLSIIFQSLGLHAWIPGKILEINFPGWSISVELFLYAMFPFLLWLFKQIKTFKLVIIITLFWLINIYIHHYLIDYHYHPDLPSSGQFILYFPLWHLNTFMFGMLCAISIKLAQKKQYNLIWPRCAYIIGAALGIFILTTDNPLKPLVHNGLMAPVFFLIVIGLALDKSWFSSLLSKPPLLLLGNSSYALYILQFPVFIIACQISQSHQLNGSIFYAYLTLLILISILVYKKVEKPLQQKLISASKAKSEHKHS